MAKSIFNTSMLLNLVLIFCFLLFISTTESRRLDAVAHDLTPAESTPSCDSVFGVRSGDTCSGIAQMFDLTTDFFDSINPNLDCDALFVGQWLCVDGSA